MFSESLDNFEPGVKVEESDADKLERRKKLRQQAKRLHQVATRRCPTYKKRMKDCHKVNFTKAPSKHGRLEDWDVGSTTICSIDYEEALTLLKIKPGRPIQFRTISYQHVPDMWKLVVLRKNSGHKCGSLSGATIQKTIGALGRLAWFLVVTEWTEPATIAKKGGFVWAITNENLDHMNSMMVLAGSAEGSASGTAPILDGIAMRKQFFSQIMACFSEASHRRTSLGELLVDQLTDEEILEAVPPDIDHITDASAARKLLKSRLQGVGNCGRGLHQVAQDEELRKLSSDKQSWTTSVGNRSTMGSDKLARFRQWVVEEVNSLCLSMCCPLTTCLC